MNNDKQDLTYLSWTKSRKSSGTGGSFLKAQETIGGIKYYYKLSDYNAQEGIVGHEAVNELIADRLLSLLGINHLNYQLIHADIEIDSKIVDTYVCVSENFRHPGESKIALDLFYEAERKTGESPLDFCVRKRWGKYIYEMLVVDFLILNRDRHGANIEVLRDSRKKRVRLSPLFDHGISLLFSCGNDLKKIQKFNVMEDRKIQSFVGTSSALENLSLIPAEKLPSLKKLKPEDKDILFEGLDDILPEALIGKIWEMIWMRWQYYEDFCDKRRK